VNAINATPGHGYLGGPALPTPTFRMKAFQLFAHMPRALALDVLEFTFANDREIYNAVLEMVAQARRVRLVFLTRQPRQERFVLMVSALGKPNLELAAENLVRNWLLKKHSALLADFLDGLKIPHDKGVVENLPDSVDDAVLNLTVDNLLNKYPQPLVAVYLRAFNHMNEARWPNLELLVECDPRLEFKPDEPSPPET
jgi:hypothetical protein